MKFQCEACGKKFDFEAEQVEATLSCPYCRHQMVVGQANTVAVEGVGAEEKAIPTLAYPAGEPVFDAGKNGDEILLREGDRVAGYTILRMLARGGMGVVYVAWQESLGREVALKTLNRSFSEDKEFVKRFEREARAQAGLSHPNIVSIMDRGYDGGVYFFVMEYVEGVSIRQLLRDHRLSAAEALKIIPQICEALQYAHDRGVVHRDIKPENILLDRRGRVKILDFGLSKAASLPAQSRITRTHTVMGTLDYMAPEQREGSRDVDHRADIYSLGVVFYEMLTGELPLGRFPMPSEKNGEVTVELDNVVLKVLEKNPDRRYQQASHVAVDVERVSTVGAGAPGGRGEARAGAAHAAAAAGAGGARTEEAAFAQAADTPVRAPTFGAAGCTFVGEIGQTWRWLLWRVRVKRLRGLLIAALLFTICLPVAFVGAILWVVFFVKLFADDPGDPDVRARAKRPGEGGLGAKINVVINKADDAVQHAMNELNKTGAPRDGGQGAAAGATAQTCCDPAGAGPSGAGAAAGGGEVRPEIFVERDAKGRLIVNVEAIKSHIRAKAAAFTSCAHGDPKTMRREAREMERCAWREARSRARAEKEREKAETRAAREKAALAAAASGAPMPGGGFTRFVGWLLALPAFFMALAFAGGCFAWNLNVHALIDRDWASLLSGNHFVLDGAFQVIRNDLANGIWFAYGVTGVGILFLFGIISLLAGAARVRFQNSGKPRSGTLALTWFLTYVGIVFGALFLYNTYREARAWRAVDAALAAKEPGALEESMRAVWSTDPYLRRMNFYLLRKDDRVTFGDLVEAANKEEGRLPRLVDLLRDEDAVGAATAEDWHAVTESVTKAAAAKGGARRLEAFHAAAELSAAMRQPSAATGFKARLKRRAGAGAGSLSEEEKRDLETSLARDREALDRLLITGLEDPDSEVRGRALTGLLATISWQVAQREQNDTPREFVVPRNLGVDPAADPSNPAQQTAISYWQLWSDSREKPEALFEALDAKPLFKGEQKDLRACQVYRLIAAHPAWERTTPWLLKGLEHELEFVRALSVGRLKEIAETCRPDFSNIARKERRRYDSRRSPDDNANRAAVKGWLEWWKQAAPAGTDGAGEWKAREAESEEQ